MSKRTRRLQGELGAFMRQYARKRYPGHDANDRGYSREVERDMERMDPLELDQLLHGDVDEDGGSEKA